jgi:hypothetical protein
MVDDERLKISAHLFRLVHIARSIEMKRVLTDVDPVPHLNFWRLIQGMLLDSAILEWCKFFGADSEITHWKNSIPREDHEHFRRDLFRAVGIDAHEWKKCRDEMKAYRDNLVAHYNESVKIDTYPTLDVAMKASCFYYGHLIKKLRTLGETKYPNDLHAYCEAFKSQSLEIAVAAVAATAAMKEQVF